MNKDLEAYILRNRPYCEMPSRNGSPACMNLATHVHKFTSKKTAASYWVAACDDCHVYIKTKEKAQ
jgi:hypothetical protein